MPDQIRRWPLSRWRDFWAHARLDADTDRPDNWAAQYTVRPLLDALNSMFGG